MKRIFYLLAVMGVLAPGRNAMAVPFGSQGPSVVVLRVGDGSQTLTNTGNTVFLDEYTLAAISNNVNNFSPPVPVQSIQMPTNWVGRNGPLIIDGTSIPNGGLSLSTDGRFLVLAGYGPTIGQVVTQELDLTTTTGSVSQVARVIGLVDADGHIYTTTTLIDANEDGNAIHSAVSLDGTNIWHVGEGASAHTGGKYTTVGSLVSTQVEEVSSFNSRRFGIFNDTLYYTANHVMGAPTNTSGAYNIANGVALPTSFVTSNFLYLVGVMGASTTNAPGVGSPYDFALFNLSGVGTAPDTLYVADNTTNAPGEPVGKSGGIVKYCYVPSSNAWVNFGYIYAEGATGLTGVKNGTNVTLYITEGGSATPGELNVLYQYVDSTGYTNNPANNPGGADANQYSQPLDPPGVGAGNINTRGIAFAPTNTNGISSTGTITAGPAVLSIGPPFGGYFSGPAGGPFSPSNGVVYSLANLGGSTTNWSTTTTAFSGGAWVSVIPSSGTLTSGQSVNITIYATNATATGDAGGFNYQDEVIFHYGNAAGHGFFTNVCTLNDLAFFITPVSNYTAVGEPGGPTFTPSSYVYTLTNVTPSALPWTANTLASWDTLSATNGTLAGGTATNITVSITANANSLPVGTYQDTLTFTNVNSNAALPTRTITLQVGFGFFDNFSTYANGDIDGQNGWYNPTPGLDDNGYQIVNGLLVTPGGLGSCAGTADDEEPAKNIASMVVTDGAAFGYLGMSVTVTSAPALPNTWDFTILPTGPASSPTVSVTYNEARTSSSDMGGGRYKWWTHVNGFDSLVPASNGRYYGTNYIVIIVSDAVNSNCWVFVDPPDGNTSDLFAMTPDTHDGPDVAGWGGPATPFGIGSVDIDNYCSQDGQPGYLISKMAMSTNYTDVYNFLTAPSTPPPTAGFTALPTSGAAPLAVSFTDTSSGSPTAWFWTFGDGNTSTVENPGNTYLNPGSYTAQLIASNAGGASSPVTQTINVYDPYAWWESSSVYNLSGTLTAGNASYTGDGMNNTNKFMAGFNPTNSAAYLHVINIAKAVAGGQTNVTVTYLGANGDTSYSPGFSSRTNILEYSTGTGSGSYTNNFLPTGQTNILSGGTGLGVVTNMTDSAIPASADRYYRVRVLLP